MTMMLSILTSFALLQAPDAAGLPLAQDAGPPGAAPAVAPLPTSQEALNTAVRAMEDADNTVANLKTALASFDQLLQAGLAPADAARAHSRKALAYLRWGDLETGDDRKMELYKKGQASAEAGLALDAKCADCHYFKGGNLGRWGQTRGVMRSLFILGDVKGCFKRTLAINPNHVDATLALALVDQKVPGFAGGSKARAEAVFKKVLKAHPHHTRAMNNLADLYEEEDEPEKAAQLARAVLAETQPENPAEYRKTDRAHAEKLLKKLGR